MIRKTQKNAVRRPRAAVLTLVDLATVNGGDPPPTKIRDTLVGD